MLTIDHTWYQRPPNLPETVSAGGVIVRLAGNTPYVAVVQEGKLPKYVLPKGTVEPGETLDVTAQREVAEEAGLTDLKLIAKLGERQRLAYSKDCWKITHYFLFTTEQTQGVPTDTTREYHLFWFPLNDLPDLFWPEQTDLIHENRDRIYRLFT